MRQARLGATGQVDLGDVTGDHRGRAETDAGQEHLHLLERGVLAFVEDDEAVVQGTATHVGQRGDFDHLAFDQLGHVFEAKHFVQGVVQRAQVRVDFLCQVAGQETELFTRLDRRAHQQDAAHLFALQRVHGAGYGQVGLAGTGRADAEIDVVGQDFLDVALLVEPARADVALARAQRHADLVDGRVVDVLDGRFLQVQVHGFRRQVAGLGLAVETAQQLFGSGGGLGFADQLELIAAVADLDGQALFDQAQVLVELAAQVGETVGLEGFEDETMGLYGCVQGRF
ncbi:hypothetical protein D3C81_1418020 [compost metagenome]